MNAEEGEKYYVSMKPKLMKNFDKASKFIKKVIERRFGKSKTEKLIMNARNEYIKLIPQMPYIGGKNNMHEFNLIGSAWMLALIRSLEKEGLSDRDIGKILYDSFEEYFNSMPGFMKWLFRRSFFTKTGIKKWIYHAEKSQDRVYPGDWVFEYVEGEGKTFDFGFNYTECGIYKFYKQQGAEKYIPYMCLGDYPMFRAMGIGMKRTQTIGNGGKYCDFRFKKGGITPVGWPPDNLEEFKLSKKY